MWVVLQFEKEIQQFMNLSVKLKHFWHFCPNMDIL